MSVLENIRKRSGLLLTVILVALCLFIVQQWLDGRNKTSAGDANVIAVIDGNNVPRQALEGQIGLFEQEFNLQSQQPANDYIRNRWKADAWDQLIYANAYQGQYDELGLTVTNEGIGSESVDMIQGLTPNDEFRRVGSTESGVYDPQNVKTLLLNIEKGVAQENPDAIKAARSLNIAKYRATSERLIKKYSDLLDKSTYITSAEAKKSYEETNTTASFNYLYVPYFSLEDSLFSKDITDEALEKHLEDNMSKYAPLETVQSFEFITFGIEATKGDSTEALDRSNEHRAAFLDSTQNDSEYIRFSSATTADSLVVKYAGLPELIKADSLNLSAGNVYGPELIGSNYKTYKVLHIIDEDSIQKASASHILISADTANMSDSLLTAKLASANEVLQKALSGDDFADLAKKFSEGPSASKGGELGEFETGQMVPSFQDAVFEARREGVVPRIVQSQFGYHIINVDAVAEKADPKFIYGVIEEIVEPSVNTIDSIGEVADDFFNGIDNIEDFRTKVEASDELTLQDVDGITGYAESLGNLDNVRSAISWAFTEAEEGDIYPNLINAEGQYGIIAYVGEASAEEVSLAAVRTEVETDYIIELKKAYILKKIAETSGTLAERESKLNELLGDALVTFDKATDQSFANNSVAGAGYDPLLVGTAFGIGEGANSAPLAGENGVYIVENLKITPAEEKESFEVESAALYEALKRANYETLVNQAIKANIEIDDQRYKL